MINVIVIIDIQYLADVSVSSLNKKLFVFVFYGALGFFYYDQKQSYYLWKYALI